MSGLFRHGNSSVPTKLKGMRVQSSLYGTVIVKLYGRNRIPTNLIGYEDFTATKQKSQGGKGGMFGGGGKGGGTTYLYSASVIMALCSGTADPVARVRVLNIYDTNGIMQLNSAVETFTVPGPGGTFTPAHASTFYGDISVTRGDTFSFNKADFGSNGVKTYAGTTQSPMVNVVSAPGAGQFTLNTLTGQYTFAAADAGKVMTITYTYSVIITGSATNTPPITLANFTVFGGTQGQAAWSYMTANHPTRARGYTNIVYLASPKLNLGSSGALPNMSFEVSVAVNHPMFPNSIPIASGDVNPRDVIVDLLTNSIDGLDFPLSEIGDLSSFSNFCLANSLVISPVFDSDQPANTWIKQILEATNSEAFMSQGLLKIAPYGDSTAVGNGATYVPNTMPIYDLSDDDFIFEKGKDPITVIRPTVTDRYNNVKMEFLNRANAYNPEPVEEFDQASIDFSRRRQVSPTQAHFFTVQGTVQTSANMQVKRRVFIINQYKFKLDRRFVLLDPMDLVTVVDPALGFLSLVNFLNQSQTFDQTPWVSDGAIAVTVTPNVVNDPQGNLTADQLAFGTTTIGQESILDQDLGFVPNVGQSYTFSAWARAAAPLTSYLRFVQRTGENSVFQAIALTTAWQRFSITITPSAVGKGNLVACFNNDQAVARAAYNIFVWGAQLETGTAPSSYALTTATRQLRKAVRILTMQEDNNGAWETLAEDFPWGASSPAAYAKQIASPFVPASNADPGAINTPIIFEAQSRLNDQIGHAIFMGLSGASSNWGGCSVWVSTDGSTYQKIGVQFAKSRMGTLTTSLGQIADPDTSSSFNVDLGISAGQMFSGSQADCDNFRTLCYVTRDTVQLVTDTFPGAALSGSWTVEQGTFVVGSGSVGPNTGGADSRMLAVRNESYPADQFAQATCVVAPTSTQTIGVCVRGSAIAETFYAFYLDSVNGYLFKLVAGTLTVLSTVAKTMQVGDTIRLEVVGTSLTAKLNGVTILTGVDSSIATGAPGLHGIAAGGSVTKLTNFVAGNDSPGELVSYQSAALVSGNVYTLGTRLRRGVAGSIITAHSIGAQFLRIDDNIFEWDFDPTLVGSILHFKFTSFNLVGHMEQPLANAVDYTLLLTGSSLGLITPAHATYRPVGNPLTATDVSQLQSDSFVRANENPLNPTNWTTPTGGQALKIVSNAVQATGALVTWSQALFTSATWPNDQYSEVTVLTASAANSGVAAIVRGATGALTYYHSDVLGPLGASAQVRLHRRIAGAYTQIGSIVTMTVNSGDKLRLEVVGTTLTVKINGAVIISQTDANIASGSPGLEIEPAASLSDAQAGAWSGGSTGSATINVVSFPMRIPGQPDIPVNLGSIPGLTFNQLYYVFYDDPAWLGGAVIFQVVTLKELSLFAAGRFFVGSIQTPRQGGPDTTGNNDGGTGAQSGQNTVISPTNSSSTVAVAGTGTITNFGNAFDGDITSFAAMRITANGIGGNGVTCHFTGFAGIQQRFNSIVLKVRAAVPINNMAGGSIHAAQIIYSNFMNTISGTFFDLNSGTGPVPVTTYSAVIPPGTNLSTIDIRCQVADGAGNPSGQVEIDIYEIWFEVQA